MICIDNEDVDISHLAPLDKKIDLDLRGGLKKKNAWLHFRFSCHCYSRAPYDGELIPPGKLIEDGSAHMQRQRIFCSERYMLSLGLPAHIARLVTSNGLVQRTHRHNIFATELFLSPSGANQRYYIFMKLTKKQQPNLPPKIDIFGVASENGKNRTLSVH